MDLETVRRRFEEDRFASRLGAKVEEAAQGYARCSLEILDWHRNAAGDLMGGVSFTLADFAFAVAANYETLDTVSLTSQIQFLGRAKGRRLTAEARCVKRGKSTSSYLVTVTDEEQNLVAQVSTTGFTKGK